MVDFFEIVWLWFSVIVLHFIFKSIDIRITNKCTILIQNIWYCNWNNKGPSLFSYTQNFFFYKFKSIDFRLCVWFITFLVLVKMKSLQCYFYHPYIYFRFRNIILRNKSFDKEINKQEKSWDMNFFFYVKVNCVYVSYGTVNSKCIFLNSLSCVFVYNDIIPFLNNIFKLAIEKSIEVIKLLHF